MSAYIRTQGKFWCDRDSILDRLFEVRERGSEVSLSFRDYKYPFQ